MTVAILSSDSFRFLTGPALSQKILTTSELLEKELEKMNVKKTEIYGLVIVFCGIIVLAIALNSLSLLLKPVEENEQPPDDNRIGFRIASRMSASEDEIAYVWCYNNTFTNLNLSTHFNKYIDGVRVGRLANGSQQMALIHEPLADFAYIDQNDLNQVFTKFRAAITPINESTDQITNLTEIWPPTYLMDLAYDNGSSLSLVFSKEHKILGILDGSWSLSNHTHHGIPLLNLDYALDNTIYLPINDIGPTMEAIRNFETLIYSVFNV
ncbi:MAG: hypothetical protein ACFFE8_01210 [Candidatus Heimdallarchaeota archaeon]